MMRCASKYLAGLLFLCHAQEVLTNLNTSSREQSRRIYLPGNILVAGLSPVHYPPRERNSDYSGDCGGAFNMHGLQHAEAILFAVEQINANKTLLPGIKLGADIRDTCNSVDYAIREVLHFQFVQEAYRRDDTNRSACIAIKKLQEDGTKTLAVVGAAYSGITMAVASLSGLFHVPVVSYASTSRLLSDRARYKYFLRTIPSDNLQVQAMVEVITRFGWNFVSTVASDTEYGRSGVDAFKSASHVYHNICIAEDALFTSRTPKQDVRAIISRIRKHSKAKVIVLFAERNDALYFVQTAREENLTDYIWLGSDAFARSHKVLRGNEHILKYWLATVPQSPVFQPFKDYFTNITDEKKRRNPWLQRYEAEVRAHLNSSGPVEYSPYTSSAIDAVYAVAHGLHAMYKCSARKCEQSGKDQTKLYSYIRNVSFMSPTGNKIEFDDAGGNSGNYYSVYYVNQTAEYTKFSILGHWHRTGGFHFSDNYVKRNLPLNNLRTLSTCSNICRPGHRKESHKHFPECCWDCLPCPVNSVSNQSNLTSCTPCKEGFKTNSDKSACEEIEPTVFLTTAEGITVICACAFGITSIFVTLVIFIRNRESAVVKASSRDISCILLVGLAWCFALPVSWLVRPTLFLCRMQPFFVSNSIALVIGPLLTKTNRIARIFSLNTMRTGRTHFLSTKWQIAFTGFCFLLENTIAATWIYVSPSRPELVAHGNEEVSIECEDESLVGLAVWATFNAGLLVLCTYQAFLVRKVPENYNEAKFIAFTMVTICICGAVYVPTYFGTHGRYRKILTCFLVILCSTVSLVCLFGPKLYIILFRPAKNQPFQPRLDLPGASATRPPYCRSTSGAFNTTATLNFALDTAATSQSSMRNSTHCVCEQRPVHL